MDTDASNTTQKILYRFYFRYFPTAEEKNVYVVADCVRRAVTFFLDYSQARDEECIIKIENLGLAVIES